MNLAQTLDVIEQLLTAAAHPDIVSVERYGSGEAYGPTKEKSKEQHLTGLKVTYRSTATALLNGRIEPNVRPVPMPDSLPPRFSPPGKDGTSKALSILRAPMLVILVHRLLDAARPAQLTSWQPMSGPDGVDGPAGDLPFGLGITCADGTKHLLLAQATGATIGHEAVEDPFPDWRVPDAVRQV